MSVRVLVLMFVAVALVGCSSAKSELRNPTPAKAASYDWEAESATYGDRVGKFENARIVVENIDRLCYRYEVEIERRRRTDAPGSVVEMLDYVRGMTPATIPERPELFDAATPESIRQASQELRAGIKALCVSDSQSRDDQWQKVKDRYTKLHEVFYSDDFADQRSAVQEAYDSARIAFIAAKRLVEDDELVVNELVGRDDGALEVEVTEIGREGLHTEGLEETKAFQVPVGSSDDGFFLSTGFAFSGVDQKHYERVNVPTSDSTVQAHYKAVNSGKLTAFAPTAMVNYVFLPVPMTTDVRFGPAGGVMYREVNDEPGLEYLLGVTFLFGDRLALTWGGHYGRRENLLLEDTTYGLPSEVNEASAVGISWDAEWALVFSWRP